MNLGNVLAVFAKELKDALRDRRTLFSTLIVPTFVIPLLSFGTLGLGSKMVAKARDQKPIVMVIGGDDAPQVASSLAKSERFDIVAAREGYEQLVVDKKVGAVLVVPPDFAAALRRGDVPRVKILHYEGELRSSFAADELDRFVREFREQQITATLQARGLPPRTVRPFELSRQNVAPPEKVGGNLLGGFVPYLIIVLCFTGAMYPAIDVTAGEKERGTMETLLCSPAARTEIVLGKFLLVLTGSLSSMLLSLGSMGVTAVATGAIMTGGVDAAALAAGAAAKGSGYVPLIAPLGLVGVLAMVLPVAVLFSALEFTIALFARSTKEAQSYLGPLMLVVLMPAIVGMLPGIDLNATLAFVPLLNLSLACKEMLSGVWHWSYLGIIFGSTCVYAVGALALAVKMFNREDVIFRT
jgi:sodium transport system permease protein